MTSTKRTSKPRAKSLKNPRLPLKNKVVTSFFVSGRPHPERRRVVFVHGRPVHVREPEVRKWQQLISTVADAALPEDYEPVERAPVYITATFYFRGTLGAKHIRRPDLCNLVKVLEDALTGIVYKDDAQARVWGEKLYGEDEGVRVVVWKDCPIEAPIWE